MSKLDAEILLDRTEKVEYLVRKYSKEVPIITKRNFFSKDLYDINDSEISNGTEKVFFLEKNSQAYGILFKSKATEWKYCLSFVILQCDFGIDGFSIVDFENDFSEIEEIPNYFRDTYELLSQNLSKTFDFPIFKGWTANTIFYPDFEGFGTFWEYMGGKILLIASETEDTGLLTLEIIFCPFSGKIMLNFNQ
jgi:hypothetical protein